MQERVVARLRGVRVVVLDDDRQVEEDRIQLFVRDVLPRARAWPRHGLGRAGPAGPAADRGRAARAERAGPADAADLERFLVLALLPREEQRVVPEESSEGGSILAELMRRAAVLPEVEVRFREDVIVARGLRGRAAAAPARLRARGRAARARARRVGGWFLRPRPRRLELHRVVVVLLRGRGRRRRRRRAHRRRRRRRAVPALARGLVLEPVQLLRGPSRGVEQTSVLEVSHRATKLRVVHLALGHDDRISRAARVFPTRRAGGVRRAATARVGLDEEHDRRGVFARSVQFERAERGEISSRA
eukprot:9629-Pelagococcus_subviridis.AAC.1